MIAPSESTILEPPPPPAEPAGIHPSPVMTATAADAPERESTPPGVPECENLYLLGRPTLRQYLRFVRSHAVERPGPGDLTDRWNTAAAVVRELEHTEAGIADDPPIQKLGPEYEPLLIELLKDPQIRNGFNTVPTEIAMVELDRMVVYQKHIDVTFARDLRRRLGGVPGRETLFRVCLPHDHPQPPARWSRARHNRYVFTSPSNDLRFLGTMQLAAGNIKDYHPPGSPVGILGVAVGFGSNFLNAIYVNKRLILNNGSHRAYALRKMGVTHVPCIIQHVSSGEELDVVAASDVTDDPEYFTAHPRPAMLRDYFDPRLHTIHPVHRRLRQIIVKFEIEELNTPGL